MDCGAFPMRRGLRVVGMVILGLFAAVVFGLVFGFVVKALWNWLMPPIFGLTTVTYWQAVGLVLLARLMVGSMGHHGKDDRGHLPKHHGHFHQEFKKEWEKEWEKWSEGEDCKDWHFYDMWWKKEGKEAFRRFVEEKLLGENERDKSVD